MLYQNSISKEYVMKRLLIQIHKIINTSDLERNIFFSFGTLILNDKWQAKCASAQELHCSPVSV